MQIDKDQLHSLRSGAAKIQRDRHLYQGVQLVGWGYKYRNGQRTDELSVVVGVDTKHTQDFMSARGMRLIPRTVDGESTDVKEVGMYRAPREPKEAVVREFTQRRRPAWGGDSVGHRDITAGTLGAWVKRGLDDDTHVILSNNHVLANSNRASIGDPIYQPGPFDESISLANRIAILEEYVRIHFSEPGDGDGPKDPKKDGLAHKWFGFWSAIANAPARWTHCPRRLELNENITVRRRVGRAVEQPFPNLVDAAVARQLEGINAVSVEIRNLGRPLGFRDLQLGDMVWKSGRTTETTKGRVVAVEASVDVGYGTDGVAKFGDQFVIESEDGDEFSKGGDSGSLILTEDGFIGGLLFAGSPASTVVNRISHVISLLGIRI